MEKDHFILVRRYKVILKDNTELEIPLEPETCYYFMSQESTYLIRAIKTMDIEIDNIKEIITYFIPKETQEKVELVIGL